MLTLNLECHIVMHTVTCACNTVLGSELQSQISYPKLGYACVNKLSLEHIRESSVFSVERMYDSSASSVGAHNGEKFYHSAMCFPILTIALRRRSVYIEHGMVK